MKRGVAWLVAFVVALAWSLAMPASVAHAANPVITSQWYTKPLRLDDLHREGFDGSGVTIAMIDGQVDPSVPELLGADITLKSLCPMTPTAKARSHGTMVASLLVSPLYGVAPKAKLLAYADPIEGTPDRANCPVTILADEINAAINDGADIITISMGVDEVSEPLEFALTRAIQEGVLVVVAAGNTSFRDDKEGLATANGVIGVGASDRNGRKTDFSTYGDSSTVLAPGVDVKVRVPDSSGQLSLVDVRFGTSMSAPLVAGLLALGVQAHPDASVVQQQQALRLTAMQEDRSCAENAGYGVVDPYAFVHGDTELLCRTSPVLNKASDWPSLQTRSQYVIGMADPRQVSKQDKAYVYRGPDSNFCSGEEKRCIPILTHSPVASPSATPAPVTPQTPPPPSTGALGTPLAVAITTAWVIFSLLSGYVGGSIIAQRRTARQSNDMMFRTLRAQQLQANPFRGLEVLHWNSRTPKNQEDGPS